MIEQTRFLSTVFLGSEFKLENIYSGVNFCGKNVWGNFYLRLFLRIAGKTAKIAKIRISGHAHHAALRFNVFISAQ